MTNVNGKHKRCRFTFVSLFLILPRLVSPEQPFATPASVVPSMGLRQQSMRAALSRQNSGLRGSPVVTSGKHGGLARNDSGGGGSGAHKEEGRVDVGGLNPPAFKLESMSACQLITYVYEAKVN